QREGGRELEKALSEELTLGERQVVADDPEEETQGDVGGIRKRAGYLPEHDIASDASPNSTAQRHQDDSDDGEVLVVVRATREQCAVERIGARRDQVQRREVAREVEAAERDRRRR